MNYLSKLNLLYYSTTGILSGIVILLFIHVVQWPVIAEISLGLTLFIHSFILARTAKDLIIAAYDKGIISDLLEQMKNGYEISKSHHESEG